MEQVLATLDRLQGDVLRRIVVAGSLSEEDRAVIAAVFTGAEQRAQTEAFTALAAEPARVKNPPGDVRTTVTRILTGRSDCVYAETVVDVSAAAATPPAPSTVFVLLRPTPRGSDPGDRNPTPFSIAAKHTAATDPCG